MSPDNLLVGKVCSSCKRELEPTREFFNLDRNNKDGLQYICRDCEKGRRKKLRKPEVKGIEWSNMYNLPDRRLSDGYTCFEEWPSARTYHKRKRPRTK